MDGYLMKEFGDRKDLEDCTDAYVERPRNLVGSIFDFIIRILFKKSLLEFDALAEKYSACKCVKVRE